MPIHEFNGKSPVFDPSVFIADTASVIGEVTLGEYASVWFSAVVRGDIMPITIGPMCNIQDNTVIHVTHDGQGTYLGEGVSLGHSVVLHDCRIEDNCLIGMNAVVLDGAVVGPNSMVGAGSLVTPRTVIPEGVLALGAPAKPVRDLTPEQIQSIRDTAVRYMHVSKSYLTGEPYTWDK